MQKSAQKLCKNERCVTIVFRIVFAHFYQLRLKILLSLVNIILIKIFKVFYQTVSANDLHKDGNVNIQAAEHGGVVFDAALQRWNALQFSYGEHFK